LKSDFPRTVLKAGVGLFYEPPSPLQIDPVFGTPGLHDTRDLQFDGGFEQDFTRQLALSVDVFYKYLDQQIVPKLGNVGTGRAYGSEVLLRYKADERFFGWLAYTISRSERWDGPGAPLHLFQFDEPQNFTILGSYLIGKGWRVGARFQVTSGLLYTPQAAGAYDATTGTYLSVFSNPPFSTRLPLFHELDLRVDKLWKFKHWQLTWYLDIENVYNYQAPAGQTYNYNYTQSAFAKGLPILPSEHAVPAVRVHHAAVITTDRPTLAAVEDLRVSLVGDIPLQDHAAVGRDVHLLELAPGAIEEFRGREDQRDGSGPAHAAGAYHRVPRDTLPLDVLGTSRARTYRETMEAWRTSGNGKRRPLGQPRRTRDDGAVECPAP
jgi:hypothetical protein